MGSTRIGSTPLLQAGRASRTSAQSSRGLDGRAHVEADRCPTSRLSAAVPLPWPAMRAILAHDVVVAQQTRNRRCAASARRRCLCRQWPAVATTSLATQNAVHTVRRRMLNSRPIFSLHVLVFGGSGTRSSVPNTATGCTADWAGCRGPAAGSGLHGHARQCHHGHDARGDKRRDDRGCLSRCLRHARVPYPMRPIRCNFRCPNGLLPTFNRLPKGRRKGTCAYISSEGTAVSLSQFEVNRMHRSLPNHSASRARRGAWRMLPRWPAWRWPVWSGSGFRIRPCTRRRRTPPCRRPAARPCPLPTSSSA